MTDQRMCSILIAEDVEEGEFANGFRVVRSGEESFLDFLIYSHSSNQAVVVARVRVDTDFLPTIHDTLSKEIFEKNICFSV